MSPAQSLRGLEEVRDKVYSLAESLSYVLPTLLPELERVTSSSSPSSAFTRMAIFARTALPSLSPGEADAVAKLARWLAVIRRDYGDSAYAETLNQVRQIASRGLGSGSATTSVTTTVAGLSPGVPAWLLFRRGIMPGVYRYGHYDWLADARLEKIESLARGLGDLRQLALEVFHSLYLLNTELAEERLSARAELRAIAEATRPLRENAEVRKYTVLDENLSAYLAAEIVKLVVDELEARNRLKRTRWGCSCQLGDQNVAKIVKEVVDKAEKELSRMASSGSLERMKNAFESVDKLVGYSAGSGHYVEFDEKVELAKILSKYKVLLSNLREALRLREEVKGLEGGSVEFAGYQVGGDISKLRPLELAYPNDLLDYRLATETYTTRAYKEGSAGRKGRRYIVLIDKSGSMDGQKLEWAKAVALALVTRRGVDDVGIMFFDEDVYPDSPLWVKSNLVESLKKIASVEGDGGTWIELAISEASKYDADIILITDGIDSVSAERLKETLKGRRLIVFYIDGWNEELAKAAHKMYEVKADEEGARTVLSCVGLN